MTVKIARIDIDGFLLRRETTSHDAATIVSYYKGFEKREFSPRSLTALFALPLIAIVLSWGTVRSFVSSRKAKNLEPHSVIRETLSGL